MPSLRQASLTLAVLLSLASQAVANPYDSDELAVRDDFDDSAFMLERYDDSLFERDELAEYLETRGRVRPKQLPKKAGQGSLAAKHARKGGPFAKKRPSVLNSKGPKRGGPLSKKRPGVLNSKGPKRGGPFAKKQSTLLSKGAKKGGPFAEKKQSTLFSKGPKRGGPFAKKKN